MEYLFGILLMFFYFGRVILFPLINFFIALFLGKDDSLYKHKQNKISKFFRMQLVIIIIFSVIEAFMAIASGYCFDECPTLEWKIKIYLISIGIMIPLTFVSGYAGFYIRKLFKFLLKRS